MTTAADVSPTCFLSYSWDSEEHKDWVRELADRLTRYRVTTVLDQYALHPGKDVVAFMERGIAASDYVILVCTPRFKEKTTLRAGGVGWEGTIVTGEMFQGIAREGKFVPILRLGTPAEALPAYLATKFYIDFRETANLSTSLEDLIRHIYNKPKYKQPTLGTAPDLDVDGAITWDGGSSPTTGRTPTDPPAPASLQSKGAKRRTSKRTPAKTPARRSAAVRVGSQSVFINCPYDSKYAPLLQGLVFAIMACGFTPRSILEVKAGDELRLERIFSVISGCRFAIHDLSSAGSQPRGLNLAFELGIFQALQRFGPRLSGRRESLVLIDAKFALNKTLSDIAGMDIRSHEGDPRKLIMVVWDWFRAASGLPDIPSSTSIVKRYAEFATQLPILKKRIGIGRDSLFHFPDLILVTAEWLRQRTA
jgi:hypothetical protein